MKFSLVAKGARAEQAATFHFRGSDVAVLFRPLSVAEEMGAEADAIKACKAVGAEAKTGQPIYEAARMVAILVAGCLDPDSPAGDARAPLFDGGSAQVCAELDTDTIGLLYEQHQVWQEQCSPSFRQKTDGQLFQIAKALAEDEHDPLAFLRLSPKTRLTCAIFMAALLRKLHAFNSPSGGSLDSSPPSDGSEPKSPSSPKATSISLIPNLMRNDETEAT